MRVACAPPTGTKASLRQWILVEQACESNEVHFRPLFRKWLQSLPAQGGFCSSVWNEEELVFVRRHIDGEYWYGVCGFVANEC